MSHQELFRPFTSASRAFSLKSKSDGALTRPTSASNALSFARSSGELAAIVARGYVLARAVGNRLRPVGFVYEYLYLFTTIHNIPIPALNMRGLSVRAQLLLQEIAGAIDA